MRPFVLLLVSIFFAGCSGLTVLGTHKLLDGTTMEVIQMTSKGESGPKIKVLETHIYDPETETSVLESRYSASGQGIVDAIISTSIPAAISGGLGVAAARARRPNKTTVTQSGPHDPLVIPNVLNPAVTIHISAVLSKPILVGRRILHGSVKHLLNKFGINSNNG